MDSGYNGEAFGLVSTTKEKIAKYNKCTMIDIRYTVSDLHFVCDLLEECHNKRLFCNADDDGEHDVNEQQQKYLYISGAPNKLWVNCDEEGFRIEIKDLWRSHYCIIPHLTGRYCRRVDKLKEKYKIGRYSDDIRRSIQCKADMEWYSQILGYARRENENNDNNNGLENIINNEDGKKESKLKLMQYNFNEDYDYDSGNDLHGYESDIDVEDIDIKNLNDNTLLNLIQFIDNWKKFVLKHEREEAQVQEQAQARSEMKCNSSENKDEKEETNDKNDNLQGNVDWTFEYLKHVGEIKNDQTPILCDEILEKEYNRAIPLPDQYSKSNVLWKPVHDTSDASDERIQDCSAQNSNDDDDTNSAKKARVT